MTLGQRMPPGIAALRLAAADVAARGAQPEIESAAALLAVVAARRGASA